MASTKPRSILCVHPNQELYGSDRVFLQAVRAFGARWPEAAITALIPGEGLLAGELRLLGVTVAFDDIFVLRRSDLRALPRRLLTLRWRVAVALATMDGYDLVYLSTIVLLDFLLASRRRTAATLIHVHELPVGRLRLIFAALLARSRGRIVFVSDAVRRAFGVDPARSRVVWNGTRASVAEPIATTARPLRVLLIGRFNDWKGQGTLIEALASLSLEQRHSLDVRLVGSTFAGQDHFTRAIEQAIQAYGLDDIVAIEPFTPVPDGHYAWSDVVVVPSTRPEPFGLVAIEAMAAARPVIASDHGGLAEIVIHEQTGLLVRPSDPAALGATLMRYAADPTLARRHGDAGRRRFAREFHEAIHLRDMADAALAALQDAA